MTVIGIDPGQTGAFAQIAADGRRSVAPFPASDGALHWGFLKGYICGGKALGVHFFLEQVAAMPGQGVSSMFKFGRNFGTIEGMLIAVEATYELVRPQVWQKEMHAGIEKSIDAKGRSLIAAQRLFPEVDLIPARCRVPHSGSVDALLIAEYGRRKIAGRLTK
jgi:hypothetical protein